MLTSQLSVDPDAAKRVTVPAMTVTGSAGSGGGDLWLPGESSGGHTVAVRVAPPPPPKAALTTLAAEPVLPDPVPVASRAPIPTEPAGPGPTVPAVPTVAHAATSATAPPAVSADVDPPGPAATPVVLSPAVPESVVSTPPRDTLAVDRTGRPITTLPLTPLLPADWTPSTLRTIVVPQRLALRGGGDTAAAVAAAVGAAERQRAPSAAPSPIGGVADADRAAEPPPATRPTVVDSAERPRADPPLDAAVDDPLPEPVASADRGAAAALVPRGDGSRLAATAPSVPGPAPNAEAKAPGKKVAVAQLKPNGGQRQDAASLPRPLPPTTSTGRTNAPPGNRAKPPAPSRGFRLPPLFDWTR